MQRRTVNPWTWQDSFGFSQAIEVSGTQRTIFCAGQTSTDEEGKPVHLNDMRGQINQALDNLETVLGEAGMTLANVVRANYYVTDIERFFAEGAQVLGERLAGAGIQPASTLLEVSRLAFPDLLIEIEATAVA